MRPFSRNKEAVEAAPADDLPFQSLRRTPRNAPRNTRKPRVLADAELEAGSPLDPAEASKTRARRRLIGAIALALAAIVFVPMLFDRTPVPPADDISLQIPDRDTPFEGRRGVPDPSRGPLRPSGDVPTLSVPPPGPAPATTTAPTAPDSSAGAPPSGTAGTPVTDSASIPSSPAATKPVERATTLVAGKAIEASNEKGSEKGSEKPKPTTGNVAVQASADDPRAVAALEGRSAAPAEPDAAGKTFAVQIAAFSTSDKARGLRDHLVANGLKSYTESVSTAQGLRTRVRLGPFASRDAADRAKQKLKTMKLDGSVVAL